MAFSWFWLFICTFIIISNGQRKCINSQKLTQFIESPIVAPLYSVNSIMGYYNNIIYHINGYTNSFNFKMNLTSFEPKWIPFKFDINNDNTKSISSQTSLINIGQKYFQYNSILYIIYESNIIYTIDLNSETYSNTIIVDSLYNDLTNPGCITGTDKYLFIVYPNNVLIYDVNSKLWDNKALNYYHEKCSCGVSNNNELYIFTGCNNKFTEYINIDNILDDAYSFNIDSTELYRSCDRVAIGPFGNEFYILPSQPNFGIEIYNTVKLTYISKQFMN